MPLQQAPVQNPWLSLNYLGTIVLSAALSSTRSGSTAGWVQARGNQPIRFSFAVLYQASRSWRPEQQENADTLQFQHHHQVEA